jgi:hypothetical protein
MIAVTHAAQRAVDVVRITAYAIALADSATLAAEQLEAAVDAIGTARDRAEAMRARCDDLCATAERMMQFAARARAGDIDDATVASVAQAIEVLLG